MKKNYTFKYGDTALSVPLEESQVLKVLEGNKTEVLEDIDKELIDAIENPIDSASLKELAEKAFNQKLDELDSMMLEGVVSRKKQIAPPLLEVID